MLHSWSLQIKPQADMPPGVTETPPAQDGPEVSPEAIVNTRTPGKPSSSDPRATAEDLRRKMEARKASLDRYKEYYKARKREEKSDSK